MVISLDGLTFTYHGAPAPALRDVDLAIGEGEFVVLAGPSGSGKSTLALALGGYLHHGERGVVVGAVRVAGRDVGEQPLYAVADRVGLVQQNAEDQFCTLRVEDEVAFGLENRRLPREEIAERLEAALALCGALDLRGRTLATLSGGEQQRVAIAAMLASRPRVLVFDEPTSNLDPTATRAIFSVLDRLRRETGLTLVVAEHKLAYLRPFLPRLVRLEGGCVVGDGAGIPPPAPAPARTPAAGGEVLLEAEGLTVRHGARAVLDGVDLALRAGQVVALMGDNGSGKTTLLRTLAGLLRLEASRRLEAGSRASQRTASTRGRVTLAGLPVGETPVSRLAREMGYLFQNPDHMLLANTVWEEVTLLGRNLGIADDVAAPAEEGLRALGLWEAREAHPFRLSYGQKRRLNLVAVTAHRPRVLLADEPLIGQDPANAELLLGALRRAAEGGACVLAALHDPESVRRHADRVLFLEGGRIVVDAPPAEAFRALERAGRAAYVPVAA
jgi:energy-coupling factor transporter ATP-binding protein EcfA2